MEKPDEVITLSQTRRFFKVTQFRTTATQMVRIPINFLVLLLLAHTSQVPMVSAIGPSPCAPALEIIAPTNQVTLAAPAYFEAKIKVIYPIASNVVLGIPVDFYLGSNLVASVARPPYSTIISNVPEGHYELRVGTGIGGGGTCPGLSDPIIIDVGKTNNNPPAIGLVYFDYAAYFLPAVIRLDANAYDIDGFVTQVEFLDGTNSLGIVKERPYSLVLSNTLTPGPHAISAKATDNFGTTVTTKSQQLGISDQPIPDGLPRVDMSSPLSFTSFVSNEKLFISPAVQTRDNNINPVEFYDGTNLLGSVIGPPYFLITPGLSAGKHVLSARMKDLNGNYSTGTTSTITVTDLRLSPPMFSTSLGLELTATGVVPQRDLNLQATTNFVDWLSLTTLQTTDSTVHFIDASTTKCSRRFYRLTITPYFNLTP